MINYGITRSVVDVYGWLQMSLRVYEKESFKIISSTKLLYKSIAANISNFFSL